MLKLDGFQSEHTLSDPGDFETIISCFYCHEHSLETFLSTSAVKFLHHFVENII